MGLVQSLIKNAKVRLQVAESNFNNAEDEFVFKAVKELNAARLNLSEVMKLSNNVEVAYEKKN